MQGFKKLERETGIEPATSTLARSHSTAELLPLVLPFYSTCCFADNSLYPHYPHYPHWHPLFVIRLFRISHSTTVRQETLDELCLGVPCLVTVVDVVHRHVNMRLAKHTPHHHRVVPFWIRKVESPCLRVVKPESRAMLRDHSSSDSRRSNVVLYDHAADSRLLAVELERREQKVRVLAVRCLLTPRLQ